jgi:hypothetical protein
MEILSYAPHLKTEKIKVNRFIFSINGSIHAKVSFQMPKTLHDFV